MIHLHAMNVLRAARDRLGGDELTNSERVELVRSVELLEELSQLERLRAREATELGGKVKAAEQVAAAELVETVRAGKPVRFSDLAGELVRLRARAEELEAGAELVARAGLVATEELGKVLRDVHVRLNPPAKKVKPEQKVRERSTKVAGWAFAGRSPAA